MSNRAAIFFLGFGLLGITLLRLGLADSITIKVAADTLQVTIEAPPADDDDDDSGGGSGGGPPTTDPVPGCIDPVALNYNSLATTNDGSCEYDVPVSVPNVNNFLATYLVSQTRVVLTWSNPALSDLAAILIKRQIGFPPVAPTDGLLIYDGLNGLAFDAAVTAGQNYFYTAFVRTDTGFYSSGAVANVTVPATEPTEEEPEEEEEESGEEALPEDESSAGEEGDGDSGSTGDSGSREEGSSLTVGDEAVDPFQSLPQVIDTNPLVQNLDLGDFVFSQPGERARFFRSGARVPIVAGKDILVSIEVQRLPTTLKTIGMTIIEPDNQHSSSFILKLNENRTAYTANLGALYQAGSYSLYIHIINFSNQTIKKLAGRLIVGGTVATELLRTTGKVGEPVVLAIGLGAGLTQALSLAGHVNSLSDVYFVLIHFWSLILRTLGVRRKFRPWGVVYDAVTKRPLDPAYVILRRDADDTATAITDLDGRYGFFLPPATYSLVANKTHYKFPSQKLAGRLNDELYDNLYFGESFVTVSGEVINRNIPLDPVAFDWNEFAKQKQGFFILHSRRERRRHLVFNSVFGLGAAVAFYQLLFAPSTLTVIMPVIYLAVFALKYIWRAHRPVVAVKSLATGQPIPFAVIRAFIPGLNQQVKSVVADELGRFFLLTPPGEYYITVEEKLPDESYKQIYQSPPMKLARGILLKDLLV